MGWIDGRCMGLWDVDGWHAMEFMGWDLRQWCRGVEQGEDWIGWKQTLKSKQTCLFSVHTLHSSVLIAVQYRPKHHTESFAPSSDALCS